MVDDLILTGEVRHRLGISHGALLRLSARGDLPLAGVTLEGVRLFRLRDVMLLKAQWEARGIHPRRGVAIPPVTPPAAA